MTADVLHRESSPLIPWSRVNIAESAPGVHTPLSWCVWELGEASYRRAYTRLCLLPRAERAVVDEVDRKFTSAFYGRGACNMSMLTWAMSALPGNMGRAAQESFFASTNAPEASASALRRAVVRVWIPLYMIGFGGRLRRLRVRSAQRWNEGIATLANSDIAATRTVLAGAAEGFIAEVTAQIEVSTGVVPQLSAALKALAEKTGKSELYLALVGGYGETEEMGMTADLQEASRGRLPMREFLQRHGFHGPATGELSSHSWREDPEQLSSLLRALAPGPQAVDRHVGERGQRTGRTEAEAAILGALPLWQRLPARVVFICARTFMPLRTTTKAAFTQSFDLIRAAARRLGDLWAASGVLERADDVFYLTLTELFELPADPRGTVAARREKRAQYQKLEVPLTWTGMPVATAASDSAGEPQGRQALNESRTLTGIGVSPGVVEGIAQVFADSSHLDEMQEGSVLVCNTTDPSWAATMMLASGLVIDVGGMLSHGAIVARELGVPCVVNTVSGTRQLRSGDRLRVDGDRGIVTVLDQAGS